MMQLICFLVTLLLFASSAFATTYTVKSSGGSYTTITACAAVAVAGDTCEVYNGTYAGFTPANSGSSGGGYITFTAASGQSPVISGSVNVLLKSYITISGFVIDGGGVGGKGSMGQRGSHIKVKNNNFTKTTAIGVDLNHDDVLIDNNTFTYTTNDVFSNMGHRSTIRNNTVTEANDTGDVHLDFFQSWGDSTSHINLQQCLIEGNTYLYGHGLGNVHYILINDTSGGVEPVTNLIVRYNKTKNIEGSYFVALDNNNAAASTKNVTYNNTLASTGRFDQFFVDYSASSYSSTMNNLLYDALSLSGAYGTYRGSKSGIVQSYNLYYSPAGTMTFGEPASSETGAVKNQNPIYNTSNFSIASNSPAVNAGGPLTTVAVADSGSGTSLYVTKAEFFQPGGWGGTEVQADWIAVGTTSNIAQISSIDYTNNIITLANTISRSDGDSVWLYKKSDGVRVLYGTAPDIGAHEYQSEVDTTAPVRSALSPSGEQSCSSDPRDVVLSLTTDENATCKYGEDVAYASMAGTFDGTGTTSHSKTLSLACDATYQYFVRCKDSLDNTNLSSVEINFTIAPYAADTTKPTWTSSTLGTDGRTLTLVLNEAVKRGASYADTQVTITPTGGAATLSYVSGDNSTTWIFNTSRVILSTETLTTSITQPGDGIEDLAGNDLDAVATKVTTNNSTQTAITGDARSIWPSDVTVGAAIWYGGAIEIGVKFGSTVAGVITGIRFYKDVSDTGTHTGSLWTSTGTLLSTVTFTGESASGWQQMSFAAPVHIAANTTYVASYFCPTGNGTSTSAYFATSGVVNSPLYALQTAVGSGYNGAYLFSATSAFPSSGSPTGRNYWVDVVFGQRQILNVSPPTGIGIISFTGSQTLTFE